MLKRNQIKTSLGAKALQAKGIASSNVQSREEACVLRSKTIKLGVLLETCEQKREYRMGWERWAGCGEDFSSSVSVLPIVHFPTDIICVPPVPRPITLLFVVPKSNFFSSKIYSQHSLRPVFQDTLFQQSGSLWMPYYLSFLSRLQSYLILPPSFFFQYHLFYSESAVLCETCHFLPQNMGPFLENPSIHEQLELQTTFTQKPLLKRKGLNSCSTVFLKYGPSKDGIYFLP